MSTAATECHLEPVMSSTSGAGLAAADLRIDCTRTVLDNGLVVIVHEDQAASQLSLSVCYRVGSKDERPGQTGSAHLFEHLMFTGSANFPGMYGTMLTKAGATQVNAFTTPDFTCFFETLPPGMLAFALYAEADRMGSFREHLTEEALAQQKAIVVEEKAQRAGGRLGELPEITRANLYPAGHPYHHSVIGSTQDITGMTLDSARAWHSRFYTPDNAAIVIGGPIEPGVALDLVRAHFSHIAPAGRERADQSWIPALPARRRLRIDAAVSHGGMLRLVWPVAEASHPERFQLELVAAMLAGDETSPLHQALVRESGCLAVSAQLVAGGVSSDFMVTITLDGGTDHAEVASRARAAIAAALSDAAHDGRLNRIRASQRARLSLSVDNLASAIGILINGEMLWRDPMRYFAEVEAIDDTAADVFRATGRLWLLGEPLVIEIYPQGTLPVASVGGARPPMPEISQDRRESLSPEFARADHANGLRTIEVPRAGSRDFVLRLDLAHGLDSEGEREVGIGRMLTTMPYHGIGTIDPVALRHLIDGTGLSLKISISSSVFGIEFHGPAKAAETAAGLLVDMVLAPRFDDSVLVERKREQANHLRAAQADPMVDFEAIAPGLLYGPDTAEVRDPGGTVASIAALTVDALLGHHRRLFDPVGAMLFTAGTAETLQLLADRLEPLRSRWAPPADPLPPSPTISLPVRHDDRIHLVTAGPDDQAIIKMAVLLPVPTGVLDEAAARALSFALQRRLGTRLRDELHWTYGVSARAIEPARPDLPPRLEIGGAFNAEHAAEAMAEIDMALAGIAGDVPPTPAEIADYVAVARAGITGSLASTGGRLAAVAMAVRPDRPADIQARLDALDRLEPDMLAALARDARLIGPAEWVVASTAEDSADRLRDAGSTLVPWSR